MKLTKKALKETAHYSCYTGYRVKYHCFYYDWDPGIYGVRSAGYKYAICANAEDCTKAELFQILYDWMTSDKADCVALPWWVLTREAETDEARFKVGISLNFDLFK